MTKFLETPDYSLADWIVDESFYGKQDIDIDSNVFNNMPAYVTVDIFIHGKPYIAVYANNGGIALNNGAELNNIRLDIPELWEIDWIEGEDIIDKDKTRFFSSDGVLWDGTPDFDAVINHFKLNSQNSDGFADFVGFIEVKE